MNNVIEPDFDEPTNEVVNVTQSEDDSQEVTAEESEDHDSEVIDDDDDNENLVDSEEESSEKTEEEEEEELVSSDVSTDTEESESDEESQDSGRTRTPPKNGRRGFGRKAWDRKRRDRHHRKKHQRREPKRRPQRLQFRNPHGSRDQVPHPPPTGRWYKVWQKFNSSKPARSGRWNSMYARTQRRRQQIEERLARRMQNATHLNESRPWNLTGFSEAWNSRPRTNATYRPHHNHSHPGHNDSSHRYHGHHRHGVAHHRFGKLHGRPRKVVRSAR